MEPQICLTAGTQAVAIATTLVTIFSTVANFVKPDTAVGKIVHFLALNLRAGKK